MRSIAFILLFIPAVVFSQGFAPTHAGKIKLKLRKLNVLSSVLYVAAHPDDENTRIITYMANDCLAATAYLSMTRGDGGQNLIGSEIRDQLGLIRTQELLAARRIDGGQQFFTRANDFGYSKSADETFGIWGKDEILSDVVKVFRQYQPDIIITRFPPDERAGHGHHTASAMLAAEAFEQAARADVFPAQAKEFGTWQPHRLYFNTGRWWNPELNEKSPGYVVLNVGGYSPLLGASFTEIAAVSRSQHKSQGFGSPGTRGDQWEFLEHVKGAKAEKNIFEGINTTWSRVKGGDKIEPLVTRALREFDADKPSASVPLLLQIRREIAKLNAGVWRERKLAEVESVLQDCLGLYIEAIADRHAAAPGEPVVAQFDMVNRSPVEVTLQRVEAGSLELDSSMSLPLKSNVSFLLKTTRTIRPDTKYSSPYWLGEPHGIGRFEVTDNTLIGKPENDPAVMIRFAIAVGGETITLLRPLVYRWTDPAKGELRRPFEVVPPVLVTLGSPVYIFKDTSPQPVNVTVRSARQRPTKGVAQLQLPSGWRAEPAAIPFELSRRDAEITCTFTVYPAAQEETRMMKAVAVLDNGVTANHSMQMLSYDHIPTQTLLPLAEAKVVRMNLRKDGHTVAYIKGAGDDGPEALRLMGYDVWEMKDEEVTAENLRRADAVVLGIRALNVNDRMRYTLPELFQYVKNGGTLVMQYNVSGDIETDSVAPYPLTLSRDRVTQEDAPVRMIKPAHPVLNVPNKIDPSDFDGWVQERGLYFPSAWAKPFDAVLSMNDTGGKPLEGSLLVAPYGSGYYVYTSLSFFRQLPEGVAGAYKLFANIVSLHPPKPEASAPSKKKRAK